MKPNVLLRFRYRQFAASSCTATESFFAMTEQETSGLAPPHEFMVCTTVICISM